MRGSPKLIWIATGVGVLVLVLACGALALVPRRAPIAIATQQQIEQPAIQFAQDEYAGTVTTVAARATTQGEVNPQRCSVRERLEQQFGAMMNSEQQLWCNDNLPLWDVTMQGEFRMPDGALVRSLQIITMLDGNVTMIDDGR
jgi:hypothetical protein